MTLLTDKWRIDANRRADIERRAEMISYYADGIAEAVKLIAEMPKFQTRAEAALSEALVKLTEAYTDLALKERKE